MSAEQEGIHLCLFLPPSHSIELSEGMINHYTVLNEFPVEYLYENKEFI